MRIAIISNLYPPHFIGGYEILCAEVVDYLRSHNHDVTVLTSTHGVPAPIVEDHVHRVLRDHIQSPPDLQLAHIPLEGLFDPDVRILRSWARKIKPDVVLVFSLDRLSPVLLPAVQALPYKKIYQVSDYWILQHLASLEETAEYWKTVPAHPLKKALKIPIAKLMLKRLMIDGARLRAEQLIFVSEFLKQHYIERMKIRNGHVVHHGVNLNEFRPGTRAADGVFKFVYTGQIIEHKGVHTIIEAAGKLKQMNPDAAFQIDLVGATTVPSYYLRIESMIKECRLGQCIHLRGSVRREEIAPFYQSADAMIFSSVWEEPFGLTVLEAMACGLPVIGTATGGSGEIMRHDENGLIYRRGEADDLALAMSRLMRDKGRYQRLASGARRTVEERFNREDQLKELTTFIIQKAGEA